jgi:hypothetical protein
MSDESFPQPDCQDRGGERHHYGRIRTKNQSRRTKHENFWRRGAKRSRPNPSAGSGRLEIDRGRRGGGRGQTGGRRLLRSPSRGAFPSARLRRRVASRGGDGRSLKQDRFSLLPQETSGQRIFVLRGRLCSRRIVAKSEPVNHHDGASWPTWPRSPAWCNTRTGPTRDDPPIPAIERKGPTASAANGNRAQSSRQKGFGGGAETTKAPVPAPFWRESTTQSKLW